MSDSSDRRARIEAKLREIMGLPLMLGAPPGVPASADMDDAPADEAEDGAAQIDVD